MTPFSCSRRGIVSYHRELTFKGSIIHTNVPCTWMVLPNTVISTVTTKALVKRKLVVVRAQYLPSPVCASQGGNWLLCTELAVEVFTLKFPFQTEYFLKGRDSPELLQIASLSGEWNCGHQRNPNESKRQLQKALSKLRITRCRGETRKMNDFLQKKLLWLPWVIWVSPAI